MVRERESVIHIGGSLRADASFSSIKFINVVHAAPL